MNTRDIDDAPHPSFRKAVELFKLGDHSAAVPLLEQASEAGDAEARNLLGVFHLNGLGLVQAPRTAAGLFTEAAAQGLKEARYNLSNMLYNGLGIRRDEKAGQENLRLAAMAGHRPALRSLGFIYHSMGAEGEWSRLSTQCFRLAAQAGDPLAKYVLGMRLQRGDGAEANLDEAAYWLSAAAADRVTLAKDRLAELRASGRSVAGEKPGMLMTDGQGLLLPACVLPEPEPRAPTTEVQFLSEYRQALDPYLCDHLINVASPMLLPSDVVDPKTGKAVRSKLRTSHSMYFKASMYDPVIACISRQISSLAGLPMEQAEPLGLLRYGPGQEYQPHYDYYSDEQHPAQRIVTVFVYLNDVPGGGGTAFPRLGLEVQPERGKAVKFLNCDAAGRPNQETLHAGLPVTRGEKWLATLWYWDRPFQWFA